MMMNRCLEDSTQAGIRSFNILAICLLMVCLGSVHAFGVLMPGLQETFVIGRLEGGAIYAAVIASLALAVLVSSVAGSRLSSAGSFFIAAIVAALGLSIAATARSWGVVLVGYGVLFGAANGLGYAAALRHLQLLMEDRRGMAIGLVTAAYGIGSVIWAWPMTEMIGRFGIPTVFAVLAGTVFLTGTIAAIASGNHLPAVDRRRGLMTVWPWRRIAQLWLGYMLIVLPGLMIIGHSVPIALRAGVDQNLAALCAALIGAGSVTGSYAAGLAADAVPLRSLLISVCGLEILAMMLLVIGGSPWNVLTALGITGLTYGAAIVLYPALIAALFAASSNLVFGIVFSAWGVAGLLGPILAGMMADWTGGYGPALLMAALVALAAGLVAWCMGKIPLSRRQRSPLIDHG
jgi:MFS family permease